jgi:cytochrome c-type biogenesis protein CcmH
MSRWRFPLWTLLALVLVAALAVGGGLFSSAPPTPAQRAAAIESVLRCPSCEDLSVADSSAPTAVTVRATVRAQVDQGRTAQQIEQYLEARYGSSIVLDPPARGWSLLVWLLPVAGALVAVAVLVVVVRRRSAADGVDDPDTVGAAAAPALVERRHFLDRSLADADAEYLAGDLSDKDYLALRRRDMSRIAALDRMLETEAADGPGSARSPVGVLVAEAGEPMTGSPDVGSPVIAGPPPVSPPAPGRSPRSRRSWWFLGGAVVAFAAALIAAVSLFSSDRLPGQTATGSITLGPSQQLEETLAEAATDQDQGQLAQAAQLYQSVLTDHPSNEVALAQLGWLEYETGRQAGDATLVSDGRAKLDRAVRLAPDDDAVRLYLGTVLLQQGDPAGAVAQYRLFLGDGPPAALVGQAAPEIRQAFNDTGQPPPAAVAGG